MRRALLALVGVSLAVALAACAAPGTRPAVAGSAASASANPIPTSRLGNAWQPAPARPGEVVYVGAGIRTMSAPATASPPVTLAHVTSMLKTTGVGTLEVGTPQIKLRRVTRGDFAPGTANVTKVTDRLEWVITWDKSPRTTVGGMFVPGSPAPTQTPSNQTCVYTLFIDANTGAEINSIQDCTPA